MKTGVVAVFKYLLLLAASVFLLVFAFKNVRLDRMFHEISKANIWWLLVSTIISFIALISRAYRWKLLIEPLGYMPALKNTTYSLMVGYFANLAFPRLGEVTRCGTLTTSENIPFNKLLGTVVIERIIDVLSLLVCIVLVMISEFDRLGSFLKATLFDPLVNKLGSFGSSSAQIFMLVMGSIILILLAVFIIKHKHASAKPKWRNLIDGFIKGLVSIKDMNRPMAFIFHSVLIWLLYYLSVYVCLFAMPFTTGLGFAAALFLLVAGGIGMSAPVQGGIGAYHLLVSQGLLLYNVPLESGLAFATLLHSLQLIMVVVTGSIALLLLFLQKRRRAILNAPSHVENINSA